MSPHNEDAPIISIEMIVGIFIFFKNRPFLYQVLLPPPSPASSSHMNTISVIIQR